MPDRSDTFLAATPERVNPGSRGLLAAWFIQSLFIGDLHHPLQFWRCLEALGWSEAPDTAVAVRIVPDRRRRIWVGDAQRRLWRSRVEAALDSLWTERLSLWREALECVLLVRMPGRRGANSAKAVAEWAKQIQLPLGATVAVGLSRPVDGPPGLTHALRAAREAVVQALFLGQPVLTEEEMDDGVALAVDDAGQVVRVQEPMLDHETTRAGLHDGHTVLSQSSRPRSPIVQAAVEYIREHLGDDLSLSRIARHCAVSPYHLSHLFRKEMDTTLTAFIKAARLEAARGLLQETTTSIAEIAYRVGFEDPNYFSKAFRAKYGLPPSEFRRLRTSFK
jgi:AraC-like DNA-binding protein